MLGGVSEQTADPRAFAQRAHGDQTYGAAPYVVHLDDVAEIIRGFSEAQQAPDAPVLRAVAYLHDVIEDTSVDAQQVRDEFGSTVGEAVELVTDPPGATRAERKQELHNRLAACDPSEPAHRAALIVKTADRLANVRCCVRGRDTRLSMYRKEHSDFRPAAHRVGLCDPLWRELDELLGS